MVDIIKYLPPISTSTPSHNHQIKNKSASHEISLPIFFSTVNNISQNERSNIIHNNNNNNQRYVGRCLGDSRRQLNISDIPCNINRNIIYRELIRYYPTTTIDMIAPIKIKQQHQQKNSNKEPLKATIGIGTTVTSLSNLSTIDGQNSRLFDTLSKHVTIKAEPLRPSNNFVNNTSNTLSSWQKYWASTQTQRRRKEANDSESIFYRSKRDQPLVATTNLHTVYDSLFHSNSENYSHSETSSAIASCYTPTKFSSSIIISDKQSSFINDDYQFSLPKINSPREKTPPMNTFKSNAEKFLSSIQNENNNNNIQTITTKIYKLPLPSNKPKINKSTLKKDLRSKSFDKKPIISSTSLEKKPTTTTTTSLPNTSVSKRKQQILSNKTQRTKTKKQQSILLTTKWDEPYVGVRFDPPTPPSSPSLFIWPQDSDQDDNDTSSEQTFIN